MENPACPQTPLYDIKITHLDMPQEQMSNLQMFSTQNLSDLDFDLSRPFKVNGNQGWGQFKLELELNWN